VKAKHQFCNQAFIQQVFIESLIGGPGRNSVISGDTDIWRHAEAICIIHHESFQICCDFTTRLNNKELFPKTEPSTPKSKIF